MNVRAKFTCQSFTASYDSERKCELRSVKLTPVTGGSEDNDKFYRWTPGGEINLQVLNPTAWQAFEVGKEYFIDFSPAD